MTERAEEGRLDGKLSLVIPAYNEGKFIYENALKAAAQIENLARDYEILIVSDGSADETVDQAKKAARENDRIRVLDYPQNMGKGYALQVGTDQAAGDYIAFCDADMELAPSQLSSFIQLMRQENADAVIGSKMHRDSRVDYPLMRRVYSWGYYMMLLLLFRLRTKDTQTGLKLFRAEVIKPVMQRILVKRFAFDIEVLAIINSRGYKIASAPVTLRFTRGALGRVDWSDIRNMAVDTLAVYYRLNILHYYDRPIDEAQGKGGSM